MGNKEIFLETKEATDIELVLFLIKHIDNPCEAKAGEKMENIRDFYLNEAKQLLSTITNNDAKVMLIEKIREYSEI